jgi:hypothetical protein
MFKYVHQLMYIYFSVMQMIALLLHMYLLMINNHCLFLVYKLCLYNNRCLFFRRLKINHDIHEFILDSGTVANKVYCSSVWLVLTL